MRYSIFVFSIIAVMSFTFFACTSEQMDVAKVRTAIEEADAKFVEAFKQGDAAAVAALYTDDATLLPPNNKMIQGKDGVQEFWNGAMQMGVKVAALTTVDVSGSGNLAYEIGKYSLTIQPEGQEATKDEGKYIVVWKRDVDGSWKLHSDIWNSSMPMPSKEVTRK